MVRATAKRRNAKKTRKLRCESADSGVDTSLNNTAIQPVQSSVNDFNGLEEEHLDFEPEVENESDHTFEKHSQYIKSDESTVRIVRSDSVDISYNEIDSVSTVSIGHGRDMLPIPQIDAKDGRHNDYLPFVYATSTSTKTLLDSSSDELSSDSVTNENIDFDTEDDVSKSQSNTGDLGNYTGNNSEYELSQEEEDRLLDDSDDEYKESQPIISEHFVETCRIGNARITLPKFVNNFRENKYRDELKRPKPIQTSSTLYKRKKWDLRFVPESVPTRVFLNDIGYIPPCSASSEEDSDCNSDGSPSQIKKLYVICNEKDKIVCEKPEEDFQRSIATFHTNDEANFKMPLPPPKRPPTRPKRTVSNIDESDKNLQIKVVNKEALVRHDQKTYADYSRSIPRKSEIEDFADVDDSISIIASTIGDNIEETSESEQFDLRNMLPLSPEKRNSQGNPFRNLDYSSTDWVGDWVKNVPNPQIPDNMASISPLSEHETQGVFKGNITVTPAANPGGNPRICFKEVPNIFTGLCYYHYFSGKCLRPNRCSQLHCVNIEKSKSKFVKSSPEELVRGYQLALMYEKLFKEIYPCFISAFGSMKMHNELIKSIKDLLQVDGIDSTDALNMVIKAFMDSGLSFLDTVEKISFNVGFLQYPVLADVLLDLITRKPNIADNWEVINRIAKARGQLSPNIVSRILNRVVSVYPVNKNLALEIYNVIIKNNMTDVSKINDDLLAPFRAIAGFRDLAETAQKTPASMSPPMHFKQPIAASNEREVLAAHIDHNLIKARERFEREVEGHTAKTISPMANPTLPANQEDTCYINSYDYRAEKVARPYDNLVQSFDADDRYFMPARRQNFRDFSPQNVSSNNRFMENGSFSSPESTSSRDGLTSSNSSLRYEPPEVGEYVPEAVRREDARMESSISNKYVSLYQPSRDLPELEQEELPITLTPVMPIFGRSRYRNDFVFDKSLHNLLPDVLEHVNIDERDVAKLNHAIKSTNGAEFLRLIEYYKSPPTIRNFITMTIAHLKSCENGFYDMFVNLIDALELVNPDYVKDIHIKAILEVVTMNLLFEFERKGQWDNARKLLERFGDWDSLISSELLQIFPKRRLTHIGRYIFLAKMFVKGKNFHFAYEILQCASLHLLEPPDTWPFQCDPQVDLKSRNMVLTDFFQDGYRYNIADVSDMYRNIFKYGGIHGYDASMHFNPMLISIINNQQSSLLKYFYSDINLFSKEMDKHVLRAFTILLANQLSQINMFALYEMCCDRQIYTYYSGGETTIIFRTNMLDMELQLILSYYFEKISRKRRAPLEDVRVEIKLFESKVLYPKMLQKCVRSIQEINAKVKEILKNNFDIYVKDSPNSKPTIVEIKRILIENWLKRTQKWSFL